MADETRFGHDRLGHLLEHRLLIVPKFQRACIPGQRSAPSLDRSGVHPILSSLES